MTVRKRFTDTAGFTRHCWECNYKYDHRKKHERGMMVSYQNCSGCKWFRIASFGMDCTATFFCKHQVSYMPSWADKTTAPPSHSVTVRPAGYRTPEDHLRMEVRAT